MNENQASQLLGEINLTNAHLQQISNIDLDLGRMAAELAGLNQELRNLNAIKQDVISIAGPFQTLADAINGMTEELKHKETLFMVTKEKEEVDDDEVPI
jgi:prephenate dehydrogenase